MAMVLYVAVVDGPRDGGTTFGSAAGHTLWLDANAAGWGWFSERMKDEG